MGKGRTGGRYSGGEGKYCECGHDKKYHIKKKERCRICDCNEYKHSYNQDS